MEIELSKGIKGEKRIIVDNSHSAKTHGSGVLDVFATPAMIALMENTAHSSTDKFLPKGMVSVGIEINAKHIKATPIGKEVKCFSILKEIEGKKLFFDIEAFDEEGKIGEAKHIRYIVDAVRFMEKLK